MPNQHMIVKFFWLHPVWLDKLDRTTSPDGSVTIDFKKDSELGITLLSLMKIATHKVLTTYTLGSS